MIQTFLQQFFIHKHTVAVLYNYLDSLDCAVANWPDNLDLAQKAEHEEIACY